MSFFSFQDIIACVTGILLLVTLLLALELITRTENVPTEDAVDVSALEKKFNDAKHRREDLEREVAGLRQKATEWKAREPFTEDDVARLAKRVAALRNSNDYADARLRKLKGEHDLVRRSVTEAEKAVRELTDKTAAARTDHTRQQQRRRVTLLGGDPRQRKPLLVECSATELAVGERVGQTGEVTLSRRFTEADPVRDFLNWVLATYPDRTKVQFVLLVRPNGLERFSPIAGTLMRERYPVGWDVWPPEKNLFGPPREGGP